MQEPFHPWKRRGLNVSMATLAGGGNAYMDPTPSRLSLWGVYLHADVEKPNVFRSLCPDFTVAPVRVPRALPRSTGWVSALGVA